jgi:hypothetical protein
MTDGEMSSIISRRLSTFGHRETTVLRHSEIKNKDDKLELSGEGGVI